MSTKHGSVYEPDVEEIEPADEPGLRDRLRAHWLAWVSALFSALILGIVLVSPQMQQGGFYEGIFVIALVLSVLRGFGKI